MVATILIACFGWLLLRQDGIDGDHVATFGWRWRASAEERLLAVETNQAPPTSTATSTTTTPAAPTVAASPAAATETTPAPITATEKTADWPGFRGPRRDGIAHSVRIKSDWSASPPVELWRRPVGPGWSSFAVNGDLFYTQEQRGENEVVACYKMSNGQPVWSHKDNARFFESNAGAGPRGTPTLSNGRVYSFGATGILNVLDANTGAVIWTRNVGTDTNIQIPFWGFSSSPLVLGDTVIVAASGQLVAYDAGDGKQRWVGPKAGGSYSSPHFVNIAGVPQILLMGGSRAISVAPADGKQLWQHEWPVNTIVQPALTSDGDVLITSQEQGARRLGVVYGTGVWTVS
jgi:outer membrane protein assembly factor BamB